MYKKNVTIWPLSFFVQDPPLYIFLYIMEQKEADVNELLKIHSRNQEGEKSVSELKSKISLSNFQMLELTQNDCTADVI